MAENAEENAGVEPSVQSAEPAWVKNFDPGLRDIVDFASYYLELSLMVMEE